MYHLSVWEIMYPNSTVVVFLFEIELGPVMVFIVDHIMFYLCYVNLNYRIGIWPYLSCHSSINYNLRQENEAYLMFTLRNPRAFFQISPFPQDSRCIFARYHHPSEHPYWRHVEVQGFVEEPGPKPPAHYQSQAASRSCVCG